MTKKLIINADDFGLSKEVNEAVEKAHKKGVLTSATIMANMPDAAGAVKIAKKLPKLGVGVHLNLFKGKPLCTDGSVERLVNDDGEFYLGPRKLAFLSIVSHPVRLAIKSEFEAQIERLVDKGIKPTHIDSHKHLHFFPAVFAIVCSLARKYEIKAVRYCFEQGRIGSTPWPLSTSPGRANAKKLRRFAMYDRMIDSDLFKTKMLFGIAHMGKIDSSFFKALSLYNPVDVAEVMTHPSTVNDPENIDVTYKPKGKTELETLCDERTIESLRKEGVELVHYGQLE
jgi:hopanoid biosynthesis associated protein HpnK